MTEERFVVEYEMRDDNGKQWPFATIPRDNDRQPIMEWRITDRGRATEQARATGFKLIKRSGMMLYEDVL